MLNAKDKKLYLVQFISIYIQMSCIMQIHSILTLFKWNLIFAKSAHLFYHFTIISSVQEHGAQMKVGKMPKKNQTN